MRFSEFGDESETMTEHVRTAGNSDNYDLAQHFYYWRNRVCRACVDPSLARARTSRSSVDTSRPAETAFTELRGCDREPARRFYVRSADRALGYICSAGWCAASVACEGSRVPID